jgi:exopolysaccharide biosynthesis polyprenyl glycosylphosphotransferase
MGTVGTADQQGNAILFPSFASANEVRRSRAQFEAITSILERLGDLTAVLVGVLLAYSAYEYLHVGKQVHYSVGAIVTAALVFATVFVIMLDHSGAYKRGNSLLRIRESERILRVSTQAFGAMFVVTFFFLHPWSRWVVALAVVFVPLVLVVEKQFLYMLIRYLHSRGHGVQNVLIYGAGYTGRLVFSALVRSPKLGLNPVAIVDDDEALVGKQIFEFGYRRERSVPVVAGPLSRGLIQARGGSLVVIGIPSLSRQRLQGITAEAFAAGAEVAFVPQLSSGLGTSTDYVDIDGVLIASLGQPARKRLYEITKRVFDVCAALTLLVLTAPLWAIVACFIRLDSEGPVFFRQTRVGYEGKSFELYKFRSMRADSIKYDFHPTAAEDPRVTRVGRWLRRTSLDELPQLINVLKGNMSLVGPRPEMPFIVERYNTRHRRRLQVVPGLTGLWQLSADRSFLIHENIQYDLYYIRDRNFFMDIAILLHTIVFAMKGV